MRKLKRNIWPHIVSVPDVKITVGQFFHGYKGFGEIEDWCNKNVGIRFRDWYSYKIEDKSKIFAFKDTETLLVFKLKWGGSNDSRFH